MQVIKSGYLMNSPTSNDFYGWPRISLHVKNWSSFWKFGSSEVLHKFQNKCAFKNWSPITHNFLMLAWFWFVVSLSKFLAWPKYPSEPFDRSMKLAIALAWRKCNLPLWTNKYTWLEYFSPLHCQMACEFTHGSFIVSVQCMLQGSP